MELEIRELDAATRQKYATRVESYIAELCRLEKEFKLIQVPHQEDRNELFDDNTTEEIYDQKQCLISNGEKLERGVNRLGIGYQLAIETEQIGNNILSDLNQQRETMQRTRNRVCSSEYIIPIIVILYEIRFYLFKVEGDGWRTSSERAFIK